MRAEKVVTYLMKNDATLAALVTTSGTVRIYGGRAPQDAARPFVVYRKQGATRENPIGAATQNVVTASMEINIVADSYESLKAVAEAVRNAVAYKFGVIATYTVNSIVIDSEGADEYDDEALLHGQQWIFSVNHLE